MVGVNVIVAVVDVDVAIIAGENRRPGDHDLGHDEA